jgi:hypothetical protein
MRGKKAAHDGRLAERSATRPERRAPVAPGWSNAAFGKLLSRQLSLGARGDRHEREADVLAQQALRSPNAGALRQQALGLLHFRAKEARGGAPATPESVVQAPTPALPGAASPSPIADALSGEGQALDAGTRRFFEGGLGADLSGVRVHSGPAAQRSARALDAHAYSVGDAIVLAQPEVTAALLAHELAHVVQARRGSGAPVLRRRSIFDKALVFLGLSEGKFDEKELTAYLEHLAKTGKIEDHYDSDNKARAVVRNWLDGSSKFRLDSRQMGLLVREMATGYVGGADQDAILELLAQAQNGDLRHIFSPGVVDPRQLENDFGGKRRERLIAFYDSRFLGGKAALYAGTVDPGVGPLRAPVFAWDFSHFRGRLEDSNYRDEELAAEIGRLSGSDRDRALTDLTAQRNRLESAVIATADKVAAEANPAKRATLESALKDLLRRRTRADTILQLVFGKIVKAEPPATLLGKTHPLTPAEKAAIPAALKPDQRTVGGVAAPFRRSIAGEPDYEVKIASVLPAIVQAYWDGLVKDKGPVEHADPTKVHALTEFETMADAAKDATDKVFGAYKTGPAFRADRPPPVGRGKLRDRFTDFTAELGAMTSGQRKQNAKALLFYFFQNDRRIAALNRHYDASPNFAPANPEAALLDTVANAFLATPANVRKLNEIDRNWEGTADLITHEVSLQIFKKDTPAKDRTFLWDMYQTLIHEYLHTLVHPDYTAFAGTFGHQSLQNNTLMEGVDSFLDEIVWQDARPHVAEPAVRLKVEGAAYAALPFNASVLPATKRRYPSYAQAVKLVNVVGVRNLYAAYFLGKVDLIKP